jgi:hypothetical protein
MANPVFFRFMVLLAKLETSYGIDPTLTGAADALLARDISIEPMKGQDVPRDLIQSYLSGQATIPAGLHTTIEFSTELAGSGVGGTAPAWGLLMRGCGCAEVIGANASVTYSPVSEAMESLYIKFWLGDTLHALNGVRGDATLTITAQGIPSIRWSFTGLWVAPAEVSRANPNLSAFKKPLLASAANTPIFTIDAVPLVLRNLSLKLGNKVEPRLLIGREAILITDRAEALDVTVEHVPLTLFNPDALAVAQTRVPALIVHGVEAGSTITVAAPNCQIKRPGGYQNNQGVAERSLGLSPLPDSGNDQFSLALT